MVGHGNCCFNQQTWGTHTEDIMEMGPIIHWFNGFKVVGAISPLWKTGCTQLTNGGLDSGAWIHTGLSSHGGLHTAILFSLRSRALMFRPCIVSEETHGNCTPQNLKLVRTSVSILTSFNQPRSKRSRNWFHLSQVVGDLAFRSHPTKGLFEPFPFGVKLGRGFFQPIDVYGQSLLLSGRRLPVLHQKVVEAPAVCDTNDLDEVGWAISRM